MSGGQVAQRRAKAAKGRRSVFQTGMQGEGKARHIHGVTDILIIGATDFYRLSSYNVTDITSVSAGCQSLQAKRQSDNQPALDRMRRMEEPNVTVMQAVKQLLQAPSR